MKIKVNPRLLGEELPDFEEGSKELEVEEGLTMQELLLDLGYQESDLKAFKIMINGRRRGIDYELEAEDEVLATPVSLAGGHVCACST